MRGNKSLVCLMILAVILFSTVVAATYVYADQKDSGLVCKNGTCNYTPLEPFPGLYPTGTVCTTSDFSIYINAFITLLVIIGAMLAVLKFSIGGIMHMVSEIANTRVKAKQQMWSCIWGLLLLISSVLILQTINPNLVKIRFVEPCSAGVS
jgi:hypothetical protein